MIFLDTNIVSEIMRPKPNPVVVEWLAVHSESLAISTVLVAEISFGISKVRSDERSPRWTEILDRICHRYKNRCFAFDYPSAIIYGEIMGEAARKGHPVAAPDGMIAAISHRHGAAVATRNVADFRALGAKVINPWG